MARYLVVYGTTEGQTRRIAGFLRDRLAAHGDSVSLHDATLVPAELDLAQFDGVVVAGSLHVGRHQTAVEHFVRKQLPGLQRLPSAFVSVSLSAAGDEEDRAGAQLCVDRFLAATGWQPQLVELAAGAFRYTEYDFFKRWALKLIAKQKGAPTDTSRDWELTDWAALDAFVQRFMRLVAPAPA